MKPLFSRIRKRGGGFLTNLKPKKIGKSAKQRLAKPIVLCAVGATKIKAITKLRIIKVGEEVNKLQFNQI